MTGDDPCPKCTSTEGLLLIGEEDFKDWDIPVDELSDDDAEVWVCNAQCGFWEEADPLDALDEHGRELEWLLHKMDEMAQGGTDEGT